MSSPEPGDALMTGASCLTKLPTPLSFDPTRMHRLEGHLVVRSPEQLRLHRVLKELGWTAAIDEFNDNVKLKVQPLIEPTLVTTNGTILTIERWRSAVFDGIREINCIEYPLSEDEALRFILTHHQSRRGWNDFIRIRLALALEPHFQQKALENMRTGGRYKGLAILPEAHRIDVRREIAVAAGVGARNVSSVKLILEVTHPRLIEALQDGTLSVNRALQLSKLPKTQQVEHFIRYSEEHATNKVIRRSIPQPKKEKASVDVVAALDALQHMEAQRPGSVAVRVGRHKRSVVLIGQDFFAEPHSQKELQLT